MHEVTYINSVGVEVVETFETEEEATEFTRHLDERIKRGTCKGYCYHKPGINNLRELDEHWA